MALILGCDRRHSLATGTVSVPERGFVALIRLRRRDAVDDLGHTTVSVPERGFVALIRRELGRCFDRRSTAFQSPSGDSWL